MHIVSQTKQHTWRQLHRAPHICVTQQVWHRHDGVHSRPMGPARVSHTVSQAKQNFESVAHGTPLICCTSGVAQTCWGALTPYGSRPGIAHGVAGQATHGVSCKGRSTHMLHKCGTDMMGCSHILWVPTGYRTRCRRPSSTWRQMNEAPGIATL